MGTEAEDVAGANIVVDPTIVLVQIAAFCAIQCAACAPLAVAAAALDSVVAKLMNM